MIILYCMHVLGWWRTVPWSVS